MTQHLGRRLGLTLLVAGAAVASLPPAAMADRCAGPGPEATLCVLNAERADAGLRPLKLDARLVRAARQRARAMAEPRAGALGDATLVRSGSPQLELPRRDSAEAACPNTDLAASPEALPAMTEATLCLLNGERADHGLAPLTPNDKLAGAATAYARDLVAGSYFSHTGRDGSDVLDRIKRSGYLPHDAGWALGENLAWGTGRLATPGSIMQAWMNSPGHRDNILNPDYREIGIGLVAGNPAATDGLGATYATEFGAIDGASSRADELVQRVARTGWLRRRSHSVLGETVAWGRGPVAAPEAVVAEWMRSAPHRQILLRPGFRRVGIAIDAGSTFVADFGGGSAALRQRAAGARAAAVARSPQTTRTSSSAAA